MSEITEIRVTCQSESMITLYKLASPYLAEIDHQQHPFIFSEEISHPITNLFGDVLIFSNIPALSLGPTVFGDK